MQLNAQRAQCLHSAAALITELQAELEDRVVELVKEFEEKTHLKVVGIHVGRFDLDARTRECR